VCLIVDANTAGEFLAEPGPVTDWLLGRLGSPRLVLAGRLKEELGRLERVRRFLVTLDRAGRLRTVDPNQLSDEERRLCSEGLFESNDPHVLSLAIVSGARTLATLDNALTRDFKNPRIINQPRGSVYRDPKKHGALLGHTPQSCGIRAVKTRHLRRPK